MNPPAVSKVGHPALRWGWVAGMHHKTNRIAREAFGPDAIVLCDITKARPTRGQPTMTSIELWMEGTGPHACMHIVSVSGFGPYAQKQCHERMRAWIVEKVAQGTCLQLADQAKRWVASARGA